MDIQNTQSTSSTPEAPDTPLFNQSYDSISDEGIDLSDINSDPNTESKEPAPTQEVAPTQETGDTTETETDSLPDLTLDTKDINTSSEETSEGTPEDNEGSSTKTDSQIPLKGPGTEGDSSPVTPFASLLQEKGFLPNLNLEEFNKSDDKIGALMQAMGNEIGYANQRFIQSFPPELMEAAKAVSEGVPYQALEKSVLKQIEYNNVTEDQLEEDESLQKRLVSDFLTSKGFKEEKISGLVTTYEDSGELKKEATEALTELKDLAKQYQEQVKQQYHHQQEDFNRKHHDKMNYIQSIVDDTSEIIPGKSLGQVDKNRLYNNMTNIVGQDENGQPISFTMSIRQQDPVKFDLAVTYLADITKGFTDFSSLNKSAKSIAMKELESKLDSNTTHSSGSPKTVSGGETSSELMSSLETMFGGKR